MKQKDKGFTIVEVLVAMSILSIFGLLILLIFTSSLRGSNKSQILTIIKENGQSVLETIDKTIRSSDNLVCISDNDTTLIVVKNGIYTRYRFVLETISTNGFIEQDNPAKQFNQETQQEETDKEFKNRICADADQMPQPAILTNTNTRTGVSARNGLFTPNKVPGYKDNVTIQFDLAPGLAAPPAIAGQIEPVRFETTIQLR